MIERPEEATQEDRRWEAAQWLDAAREDVRVVYACLGLFEPALGGAAYHCQQAAEKLTKGLLIVAEGKFPRTHDIETLGALISPYYAEISGLMERMKRLTDWNGIFRYPGSAAFRNPPDSGQIAEVLVDIAQLMELLLSITTEQTGEQDGG